MRRTRQAFRPGRRRVAAWLAGVTLLAGCATPHLPADRLAPPVSGRMLIKVDATDQRPPQSLSAAFELSGTDTQGHLILLSPLGTLLADARWTPVGVQLSTADGVRRFDDLPALSREALGEDIPLQALTSWLAGKPWPGAAYDATAAGFAQLGWGVDLSRWSADAQIEARRASPPAVLVRARIDR